MKSILEHLNSEDKETKTNQVSNKWLDANYEEGEEVCCMCKGRGMVEVDEVDPTRGVAIVDNNLKHNEDGTSEYYEMIKQKCVCVLKRDAHEAFKKRIKRSGLMYELQDKTFKTYKRDTKVQKDLYNLCYNFVKEPEGLLAMLGNSGIGKTHLGTAVVGNLAYKGYDAIYVEWRDEVAIAKDNYHKFDSHKLDQWREVDVLYIDDLFKNKENDSSKISDLEFETAWNILDSRLKRNKTTIISSEYMIQDLMKVDVSLAGRIVEMAGENIINLPVDIKANYRLRNIS